MIIGLTGSFAAGKDTVAAYLVEKGYVYHSLSDLLREELKIVDKPITRANLISIGNSLRAKFGAGELAKRTIAAIKKSRVADALVVSFRNPEEVNEFRKLPGFTLWFVDAPQKMRYERARQRNRSDDFKSFEEFQFLETRENSDNPNGQQLSKVFAMADKTIVNDKDIKTLQNDIDQLLEEPIHENRE